MMDEGRFLSLFLKHERELASIARAFLPDWNAVDDVLQEASLVMWRKIHQLESDDEFLPWSKVILRFEILKARRRHARQNWVLSEELISKLMDESAEDEAEMRQAQQSAIQHCLQSFSEDHQKLLLAPHTSRGGVLALAEAGGHSANSLYKRIGRLRVKLHDCVVQRLSSAEFDLPL
jgi:RNA polymerase sigma-70 factor (ECF subfamily)